MLYINDLPDVVTCNIFYANDASMYSKCDWLLIVATARVGFWN